MDYLWQTDTSNGLSLIDAVAAWLPGQFADTQKLLHLETINEYSKDPHASSDLDIL
jgi:hypothetical protein